MWDSKLLEKIEDKTGVIGIVGLGYVGLPLAIAFKNKGYMVYGYDTDINKVNAVNDRKSYINHIKDIPAIHATNCSDKLNFCDFIIVTVPTPLTKHRIPDLSYLTDAVKTISLSLRSGQFISIESTTYPGTTREELIPILESSGLKFDEDFFVAFSPEREDPNNANYTITNIPKVVGGCSEKSQMIANKLYGTICDKIVPVSNSDTAEMTKLLENIFRTVNIALVNEMKLVCHKLGINIWEVIDAAKTKPFGFMPFYPSPGLGGHCLPLDPFYLSYKAAEKGMFVRFIEIAGEINANMPYYVVKKTMEAMSKNGDTIKNSNILILGLAYKKDVGDIRESPAITIITELKRLEANIYVYDPFIKMNEKGIIDMEELCTDSMDCVIVVTDHTDVDYEYIAENAYLIIDTRNIFAKLGLKGNIILV